MPETYLALLWQVHQIMRCKSAVKPSIAIRDQCIIEKFREPKIHFKVGVVRLYSLLHYTSGRYKIEMVTCVLLCTYVQRREKSMRKPFSVLVVCGTGIATSTMVATKVKEYADKHAMTPLQVRQGKVMDLLRVADADVIVATTQVPNSVKIPVINAIPLLTGIGAKDVFEKLECLFNKHKEEENGDA